MNRFLNSLYSATKNFAVQDGIRRALVAQIDNRSYRVVEFHIQPQQSRGQKGQGIGTFSNSPFVPGDRGYVVTASWQKFDNQKTLDAYLALIRCV